MYRDELLPFKKKLDFILFFAILSLIHFYAVFGWFCQNVVKGGLS